LSEAIPITSGAVLMGIASLNPSYDSGY